MPAIEVRIRAEGSLPAGELDELSALGIRHSVAQVVLDGSMVDQAALMGVLERLRRAGLTIRDVAPCQVEAGAGTTGGAPGAPADTGELAEVAVAGRVGELVRSLLPQARVSESNATTLIEIDLTAPDEVFEVLHRLEALALELCEVHVGPRAESPGEGLSSLG